MKIESHYRTRAWTPPTGAITETNVANESSSSDLSEHEISRRIHAFILDRLLEGEDAINLTDSTPLISGGVIDSVNALEMGLFLEKSFSIKVAPEELTEPQNMETIALMTKLVISKI